MHLFIINPQAAKIKGRVDEFIRKIQGHFNGIGGKEYAIHVTRWSRDAVGFVRRCIESTTDTVRVHSIGGSGTVYEVVNGMIGAKNAEIAIYPFGNSNTFIQYFMRKNRVHFENFSSQIDSKTILIDAITDGTNYGVSNFITGIEAEAFIKGGAFAKRIKLFRDLWPRLSALSKLIAHRRPGSNYRILLDDEIQISDKFVSIMTANAPCYHKKMNPAVDAHPNDGILDIYITKSVGRLRYLGAVSLYTSGNYAKRPKVFSHYTCRKISIECDSVMHTSFDGEVLFAKKSEFSVVPSAIKMVLPKEIDMNQIPARYQG